MLRLAPAPTVTRVVPPPAVPAAGGLTANLILLFLLMQVGCQIALIIPGTAPIRVFVRTAAFGVSLLLLIVVPRKTASHPALGPALAALLIVGLSVLHPTTNTVLAGLAHVAMYLAILGPLFWVAGLRIDERGFKRVMLMIWGYNTLSACVGVLQVYNPGQFVPDVGTMFAFKSVEYREGLKITLANGDQVWRPLGLSDFPGGAGTAGMYALLFALGFLVTERRLLLKGVYLASMAAALFCIYLCQIRSLVVMSGICLIAFAGALAWRRDFNRLAQVGVLVGAVVLGSFAWAIAVGGKVVTNRLSTLVEGEATDVYYRNRGIFLGQTINEHLPEYPLGAGLGRWGMMYQYFGDKEDPDRATIWVEIQWTGWLLDGGLPLVLAYGTAVLMACWFAWRLSLRHDLGDLSVWAALIFAYSIGGLALTFNYPLFMGQTGLEFWLLNATLFAAYQNVSAKDPAARRA